MTLQRLRDRQRILRGRKPRQPSLIYSNPEQSGIDWKKAGT